MKSWIIDKPTFALKMRSCICPSFFSQGDSDAIYDNCVMCMTLHAPMVNHRGMALNGNDAVTEITLYKEASLDV